MNDSVDVNKCTLNTIRESTQEFLTLLFHLCTILELSSSISSTLKQNSLLSDFIYIIHQALQQFYGHKATFNSSLQSDTLTFILGQTWPDLQFYIILNIRFKKSLLYQLSAALCLMNIYVIVTSYCVLKQNIHHCCCSLDLSVHIWEKNTFKLLLSVMTVRMKQTSTQNFQN